MVPRGRLLLLWLGLGAACLRPAPPDFPPDPGNGAPGDGAAGAVRNEGEAGSPAADGPPATVPDGATRPPDAASPARDGAVGPAPPPPHGPAPPPIDGGAVAVDASAPAAPPSPAVTLLTPAGATPNSAVSVEITGTGFADGVVVMFGGLPLAAKRFSTRTLVVEIPVARTAEPGQFSVWVENPGMPGVIRSNTLYFLVSATAGPEIVDYTPDNGVAGNSIRIVGRNLMMASGLKITDPKGTKATPGATGFVNWGSRSLETVQFELPRGWQTGPITVANARGTFRGKVFNVGPNLAVGGQATGSSHFETWSFARGIDNQLITSWFAGKGSCTSWAPPTCQQIPWFMVTFPSAQTVGRIAFRGNRENAAGFDFIRAKFEVVDGNGGVLWTGTVDLPPPERDFDLNLPTPVSGARSVRVISERDESHSPGIGELEVFGP